MSQDPRLTKSFKRVRQLTAFEKRWEEYLASRPLTEAIK